MKTSRENQENKTNTATYAVGNIVPENGFYICVPCGNKQYLKAGARFKNCLKCLGKDWRLFKRGLELWEKIEVPRGKPRGIGGAPRLRQLADGGSHSLAAKLRDINLYCVFARTKCKRVLLHFAPR